MNGEARREALDPLDLYDIAGSLSEEERMVQGAVARLVDEKVLPVIQKHFEDHTFPRDLVPEIASLGLLGSSISGYGCAGMNSVSYGLICQELERGDSGIRSFVSVQSSLVHVPDPRLRQRGAAREVPAAHGDRRADRLLRPHRAARRLRPGQHEDAREAPRRRTGS